MLADTSFLIDVMEGHPGAATFLRGLDARGEPLAVAAVSVFELHRGIARSRVPRRELERIRSVVGSLPVVPLDRGSAERGGAVAGELLKRGLAIDPEDAMIAGTALRHGQSVVTANARHFRRVDGLDVVTYR